MDGSHADDDDDALAFRTVFEYSAARAYARRRVDDCGRCFSPGNVFVNNGDTYNAAHVIRRFRDGRRRRADTTGDDVDGAAAAAAAGPRDVFRDGAAARRQRRRDGLPAAALDGLAALTRTQYETFLDQPSAAAKVEYLRRAVGEFAAVAAETSAEEDVAATVLTTLRWPRQSAAGRLDGCRVVAKDDAAAWRSALMQCAAFVFDVSGGADDEVDDARAAFGHVHGELMKCSDEQLARWRDDGTVRCFVLVSTVMSWAEEPRGGGGGGFDDFDEAEEEERRAGEEADRPVAPKNALYRAPVTGRSRAAFELEKAVLRANSTRTKDVFRCRVIGVGVTYGHEQQALRGVFERAWLGHDDGVGCHGHGDDDDGDDAAGLGRRTVPAVHVDELAELVRETCARARRAAPPPTDDRAYALAVERPSYEFADIVDAVRDGFRRADGDCRGCARRRTATGSFANDNGSQQHARGGDSDRDRYGLGHGFTLELMLSDLDADHPALQDFIAAPVGRHPASSLVPDARRLVREYVAARGLRPFRLLVSGWPRRVAARVASCLARRYRVPLVDASRAIDDRADRLRAALDDARRRRATWAAGRRAAAAAAAAAAASAVTAVEDEWSPEESAVDVEPTAAAVASVYGHASDYEDVEDAVRGGDDDYYAYHEDDDELRREYAHARHNEDVEEDRGDHGAEDDEDEFSIEIREIKRALANLDVERKQLGRNVSATDRDRSVDSVDLLPMIRESLCSCSCRNRGYVLDVFPLSVERLDVIFNGDVDFPGAVAMLSYDPYDPDEIAVGSTAAVNGDDDDDNDDDDEGSRSRLSSDHRIDRESGTFKVDHSAGYLDDDYRGIDVGGAKENSDEKNYCGPDEAAQTKRVVKYFTEKRCKILSFKVPFGLIDDARPNDWQYAGFTESIVAEVGRPQFADDVYETAATDARQTTAAVAENKTIKTKSRTVSRTVSEKLNAMREEWNGDIVKAIKRDKLLKYEKNAMIQNYVNTNILPKLLKEVSPIGDSDVYSVSRFPEKALNKSKLCRTRPDNDSKRTPQY